MDIFAKQVEESRKRQRIYLDDMECRLAYQYAIGNFKEGWNLILRENLPFLLSRCETALLGRTPKYAKKRILNLRNRFVFAFGFEGELEFGIKSKF